MCYKSGQKNIFSKKFKKGVRLLAHLWLYVVNYSSSSASSALLAVEGTAFFFEETLTKIAAADAISAVIATIVVSEPSPKMDAVELNPSPKSISPLSAKVVSPRSQSIIARVPSVTYPISEPLVSCVLLLRTHSVRGVTNVLQTRAKFKKIEKIFTKGVRLLAHPLCCICI